MSDLTEAKRLYQAGRLGEAEETARGVLERSADEVDALNIVALCAMKGGRFAEALPLFERVVQLKPHYANSRTYLAMLLFQQRKFGETEQHARAAIARKPTIADAHAILGRALAEQGRKDEGARSLQHAIELDPNHNDALYWLGFIAQDAKRYDVACDYYARLLQVAPNHIAAIYSKAFSESEQGFLDEALATYRRGISVAPQDSLLHSNMLFALAYHPSLTAQSLHQELALWAERHAKPLMSQTFEHDNSRDPDRRLRIGYVSPYFREHAISFFLEPILEHHDRERFEILLYSDVEYGDAVTARIRQRASQWRDTLGQTDASVADLVRADRIDVLVDLTQHSGGSRLPVFARKPAPVQVCYLGYPLTTGLSAIDYRLSDAYLDPPDHDERFRAERMARLPETYFCYRPPEDAPRFASRSSDRITFVSQNALPKLNERCLGTWARVMHGVMDSRLIVKASGCGSDRARQRIRDIFQAHGIDPARIEFRNHGPLRDMLAELAEADVALDTFPYNGGTTTCHVLWMGVPVVSVAGELPVHRMGLSVLSQVGLSDLVAKRDDEFVEIATKLARDMDRLRDLRATLRDRMRASPLMDARRFTANLEAMYRQMWQAWCKGR